MTTAQTMTSAQLHAVCAKLSKERRTAGQVRRQVITRVLDSVLDEINRRKRDTEAS